MGKNRHTQQKKIVYNRRHHRPTRRRLTIVTTTTTTVMTTTTKSYTNGRNEKCVNWNFRNFIGANILRVYFSVITISEVPIAIFIFDSSLILPCHAHTHTHSSANRLDTTRREKNAVPLNEHGKIGTDRKTNNTKCDVLVECDEHEYEVASTVHISLMSVQLLVFTTRLSFRSAFAFSTEYIVTRRCVPVCVCLCIQSMIRKCAPNGKKNEFRCARSAIGHGCFKFDGHTKWAI